MLFIFDRVSKKSINKTHYHEIEKKYFSIYKTSRQLILSLFKYILPGLKPEMTNEGDGDDEEDEDACDKVDVEKASKTDVS